MPEEGAPYWPRFWYCPDHGILIADEVGRGLDGETVCHRIVHDHFCGKRVSERFSELRP